MRKTKVLKELEEITRDQESAIASHGNQMITMFEERKASVMREANLVWNLETHKNGQSGERELKLLASYVCVSSFISAWYHLAGLKRQRDKAAHSCATLICELGLNGEEVLTNYIGVERIWRRELREAGLAPRNSRPLKVLLFIGVVGGAAYLLLK